MSLRIRFAAAASLAVAVVTVFLAVAVYASTRSELRGQVDTALDVRARAFVEYQLRRANDDGSRQPQNRPPPSAPFGGFSGTFQSVSRAGVASRASGQTRLPVDTDTLKIAKEGSGRHFSDATISGRHLRILAVGVGSRGAVQVARDATDTDRSLNRLAISLALMGAGAILLAGLLGALVARLALAPIRRFTARTETIVGDPDLSHRLDVRGDDELSRLAASFNAALAALEASSTAQRRLIADASHELRTPLASLRTNVQILDQADRLPDADREALRADILAEVEELTAVVADVVELARGSHPTSEIDENRLDLIVSALAERFERRPGAPSFSLTLEETVVRVDAERISRAVSNLFANAAQWSPPDGVVEVVLHDRVLTVRDHGPGFVESDLPQVFDRFYRADAARSKPGSGLGLAIVHQAVEAAGGTVAAANSTGGGAIVRIELPAV